MGVTFWEKHPPQRIEWLQHLAFWRSYGMRGRGVTPVAPDMGGGYPPG